MYEKNGLEERRKAMSSYVNGTIDNGKGRTSVRTESGTRLLDVLREVGAEITAPCGGNGTCGKCRVRAVGVLSEMGDDERRFLDENEIARGVRLACKCGRWAILKCIWQMTLCMWRRITKPFPIRCLR